MTEAVQIAVISGLCVAVPSVIATIISSMSNKQLIMYRIDQLESKVNKHNSVIDRTYKLEKNQSIIQEQIKVANHRIEDLEKDIDK